MSTIGDNSAARLRSLVERIERLEGEKAELADDIKGIYVEAKSAGYDPKVLRALIAERKKSAEEVAEREALLETDPRALAGMEGLPLAEAAMARAAA